MERVLIIGCGGAGKSHLARQLAAITGLPVIHLDAEYWLPGWVEPPRAEWRQRIRGFSQSRRWIIDGNYGGTLEQRLADADTVFFLDFPTLTCLYGISERLIRYRGRTRPDMTPGCPEHFDWEFLLYVLSFRRHSRLHVLDALRGFKGELVTLTSRRAVNRYLESLTTESLEDMPVSA